ncbi:conserved hypothetical protein [Ricinus communis]|uniref:Uncharacterized protein n=1 Tax=Ricinus communis TaxID=3988 RepID=B9SPB1_RICCO|nr:conserved hypothetical protein [Ricinus communis]
MAVMSKCAKNNSVPKIDQHITYIVELIIKYKRISVAKLRATNQGFKLIQAFQKFVHIGVLKEWILEG